MINVIMLPSGVKQKDLEEAAVKDDLYRFSLD